MSIRIYNSLTKEKEDFPSPENQKIIRMYSCGVTVYDHCHIGHARSLYIFDVITRYLRYRGYDVHFVRNITDIDDKIINKAKAINKGSDAVAAENILSYEEDLRSLGIPKASHGEPKATENIASIIEDVGSLIQKGFAYESDGDVYYSVRKFAEYGKLSKQSVDKMLEAVRIDQDKKKKDPLDFALWKKSQEGEPFWESPWGNGRPGWHIECSCMSLKHLQCETLDIHAGGRDLIFPHHENEIAQAEAITGKPFAKFWIHHGLLTINGQKMAKSLGNFITIKDAIAKHSVDNLKLFFLSSHYASPIDFSEEKLVEAKKALDRFDVLFWRAAEIVSREARDPKEGDFVKAHRDHFIEAMDDDFNTPKALASLFDLINDTNKYIDTKQSDPDYAAIIHGAINTLEEFGNEIFGLFLKEPERVLTTEEDILIKQRISARAQKDFKKSDELRDLLKTRGIVVEDTKDGQVWRWA